MTEADWRQIEVFGGYVRGLDDEGYLEVFDPDGNSLCLIEATRLLELLQRAMDTGRKT